MVAPRSAYAAFDKHDGDRLRLFAAVADHLDAAAALYPGSHLDIAASVVFPDVTYVDVDRRAVAHMAGCIDDFKALPVGAGRQAVKHQDRTLGHLAGRMPPAVAQPVAVGIGRG